MKFFNTAGPSVREDHYRLPPLERFDLDEIMMLIAQKKFLLIRKEKDGQFLIKPYD